MVIHVSVSQTDPTHTYPYLSKPTNLAVGQVVYAQACVPEMKSAKWHIQSKYLIYKVRSISIKVIEAWSPEEIR